MFRPRVIPVLLLQGNGLVKSEKFKNHRYIGDPINAVRTFNDLKADELVFLDINATKENRTVSVQLVKRIGEEANMPFSVGGGIKTIEDAKSVLKAGAEKIVLNTIAAKDASMVTDASKKFGSSSVVVCIDVKKNWLGKENSWIINGSKSTGRTPIEFAKEMEDRGAGELVIQSMEMDGTMKGYDLSLIKSISDAVAIPVVALGGAGNTDDLIKGYAVANASAVAAGSMFVYHGSRKAVLINYPDRPELSRMFN